MRGQLPGSQRPLPGSTGSGSLADSEFEEFGNLLDKEYTCPVCGRVFTAKEVKSGVAKQSDTDLDLRPVFKNIDVVKYRVVECPACGFADLSKTFNNILDRERKILKEKRVKFEKDAPNEEYAREYAESYRMFKSALRSALIRGDKSGKRAYLALNAAWVLRGWREKLEKEGTAVADSDEMSANEERKLIKFSLKNFQEAETKETFPIAGVIDEPTFDYLMAVLCYKQDQINDAGRYILRALQNKSLMKALRPKAEDVRDMIKDKRNADK